MCKPVEGLKRQKMYPFLSPSLTLPHPLSSCAVCLSRILFVLPVYSCFAYWALVVHGIERFSLSSVGVICLKCTVSWNLFNEFEWGYSFDFKSFHRYTHRRMSKRENVCVCEIQIHVCKYKCMYTGRESNREMDLDLVRWIYYEFLHLTVSPVYIFRL